MSRLVFTVITKNPDPSGPQELGYDAITVPYHHLYAKRISADYLIIRGNDKVLEIYNNVPAWLRVDFMANERNLPRYDEYLYIDADVMPNPSAPNIFALGDFDWAWCHEAWCGGIPGEDHKKWVRKNFNDEAGGFYCNAGVIAFTARSLDIIDFSGPYPSEPLFDQCYLNYRVHKAINCGLNMEILDPLWNMIPYDANTGAYFYHCAFEHKSVIRELDNHFRVSLNPILGCS